MAKPRASSRVAAKKPAARKPAAKKPAAKPAAKKPAAKKPAAIKKAPAAGTATGSAMPWASDAWGLARVRPGFAKTPADDVLFALGYPHIVVPTDDPEPKGSRDPSKYWKFFSRQEATHVPRGLLPFIYACHCRPKDAAAIFTGPPPEISLDEEISKLFYRGDRMVFFLEALVGSEAVATAAVKHLASCPDLAWKSKDLDQSGWNGIRDLGFVLLRVSPAVRAKLITQLEAVFTRQSKAQGKEWWRPVEALDIMLHGKLGIERTENSGWSDLSHERSDSAWVASRALAELKRLKPTDRALFDSQIAFIGGAKVIAAMQDLKKFFSEQHADAKRQLARIA